MTSSHAPTSPTPEGDRIAKVIARAGICSRREAERLITEGRVTVNGKVIASPALNVTGGEKIIVDGKELPAQEPTRLWRYYKEEGLVTTARDPEGRPTVFEKLPPGMPRVVSVGRLDVNTEGLLLLTNDGELARLLELPSTGWTRRYRVRAYGTVTQADLDRLKNGIVVEGVRYGPMEATLDKVQGSNVWLTLGLKEGKNREVKRVLGELGLRVNRLIRLSFGPFQIGDMLPGEAKAVPNRVLLDQLGAHAARFEQPEPKKEAGVAGPRANTPHVKAGQRPTRHGKAKPKGETVWTKEKVTAGKPPARSGREEPKGKTVWAKEKVTAGKPPARPGREKPKGETAWTREKVTAGKPPARPGREEPKGKAVWAKEKVTAGKPPARPGREKPKGEAVWTREKATAGKPPARPGREEPKGKTVWAKEKVTAGKPPARPGREKPHSETTRTKTTAKAGQPPARAGKAKPKHKGKPNADRRRHP